MPRLVRMAQLLALTEADTEDCLSDIVSTAVVSPTRHDPYKGIT